MILIYNMINQLVHCKYGPKEDGQIYVDFDNKYLGYD